MKKLFAFIKKEFLIETSYRFAFLWQIFSILFSILIFYFISRLFGNNASNLLQNYGGDYFSFVLIGLAFSNFLGVGLGSFSGNIRSEQVTGTIESLFLTPVKSSAIVLGLSAWNFCYAVIQVLIYFIFGVVLFGINFNYANLGTSFLIFILTLVSLSSIGIISAGFITIFKRGDPVAWIIGSLFDLLGGVFFPVSLLPQSLQNLSSILPITHSLNAMRLALLQGYTFKMLLPDILFLLVFSIIAFPLSLAFFNYAVKRSKIDGSLSQY